MELRVNGNNGVCKSFKPKSRFVELPCEVGQTVYVLEPCQCYNDYREFEHCHHRRTKATKWIEMVRLPSKHHTKCLKLFERGFKLEYLSKIGKTVFLSKEQAEKALKEREKEWGL
jgi:hypothetical protein